MKRRQAMGVAAMLVAPLAGWPTGSAGAPIQPALSAYAVLGTSNVLLKSRGRVESGSVGSTGGELRLGAHVTVSGSAAADIVVVGNGVTVDPLFCRLVRGAAFGRGVVGGPSVQGAPLPTCQPLVPPIVDPTLLAPVPVTPGTTELRVPPRTGTAPYPPGTYADVTVGAGSLLQLAGGDFQVRSISIAPRGRLVCTDVCRIGVLGSVLLHRGAQIGVAAPMRARNARIDVAGSADTPVFVAGAESAVAATIFAPTGDIVLGRDGSYRGAFIGRAVTVKPHATVHGDSAL